MPAILPRMKKPAIHRAMRRLARTPRSLAIALIVFEMHDFLAGWRRLECLRPRTFGLSPAYPQNWPALTRITSAGFMKPKQCRRIVVSVQTDPGIAIN